MTTDTRTRAVGRPRSEATRKAILAATMKLMERTPIHNLTIDAIARGAKASRATVYRWWPHKAAVVIDAVIEHQLIDVPIPETMSAREAMTYQISRQVTFHQKGRLGRHMAAIMAEAQSDPKVLATVMERFWHGRSSATFRDIILRGQQSGEFCRDLNVDLAIEMIVATINNRLVLIPAGLNEDFAQELPKLVLRLLAPTAEQPGAGSATRTTPRRKGP